MDRNKLYLKVGALKAMGYLEEDRRFRVLKGSPVSDVKTMSPSKLRLRMKLEEEGVISLGRFESDYIFDNHSTATTVIRGSTTANVSLWMTEDGYSLQKALADFDEKKGPHD